MKYVRMYNKEEMDKLVQKYDKNESEEVERVYDGDGTYFHVLLSDVALSIMKREEPLKHITKEETILLHRRIYNIMADESIKQKRVVTNSHWLFESNNMPVPHGMNYCCSYAHFKLEEELGITNLMDCRLCPIKWSGNGSCSSDDSEFTKLFEARRNGDWEEYAKWARAIANLPVNEDA